MVIRSMTCCLAVQTRFLKEEPGCLKNVNYGLLQAILTKVEDGLLEDAGKILRKVCDVCCAGKFDKGLRDVCLVVQVDNCRYNVLGNAGKF